MTEKKKSVLVKIIIAYILAAIVFTVIVLVLPFSRGANFWLAYVFAVAALVLHLLAILNAFGREGAPRSRFYGIPVAKLGTVYLVAQVVLSIVTMLLPQTVPLWIPLAVFAVLLCLCAIGFITVDIVRTEIERQDDILSGRTQCIIGLRSKVNSLVGFAKNPETNELLRRVSEEFRYSDPVSSDATADVEKTLESMVADLQSAVVENEEVTADFCNRILLVLAERNRLCKVTKRK